MDIKKFIYALNGCKYGINKTNITTVLKEITEALDLQTNPEWRAHCMVEDARHCNEYLILDEDSQLRADGRKLKEYPADKITLDLIKIATNAPAPLTIAMIKQTKKIRDKLTNEFLCEKAIKKSSYDSEYNTNYAWLDLWNKNGPTVMDILKPHTTDELFKKLSIVDSAYNFDNITSILSKIGICKSIQNIMNIVTQRKQLYLSELEKINKVNNKYTGMLALPLSDNEEENDAFISYLRISGFINLSRWHNVCISMTEDGKYHNVHEYVKALLLCYSNSTKLEGE